MGTFFFYCFFTCTFWATGHGLFTPNLIVLLADDYGAGDPSPPLGVGPGLTPHLNAFASSPNAVIFPRGYIGGSVCSPSRASLLTGRSPTRDCVISVEAVALPLELQGNTLGDVLKKEGYRNLFSGKFHLGSLSNSTTVGCYTSANATCLPGYILQLPPTPPNTCCDARDGHLPQRTPLDFGFTSAWATSQVAPSATSNCGCLATVNGAGHGCEMGHYEGSGHYPEWVPGLECMSTMHNTGESGAWEPFSNVTAVDDAEQLVDVFEAFLAKSVAAGVPFFASIWFHQTHIPYVAPPAFRALYPNATPNEADYYGSSSAMDAQVGRVRALLAAAGVANTTLVIFTSDNGPEVDPAGGQGTGGFPNPGLTGGLSGRKRALLEGGVRVPFLVEAPWLVRGRGPLTLPNYAASHMDILPTMLDLLGQGDSRRHPEWPLDGASLVPALEGKVGVSQAREGPLGWLCLWPLTVGDAGADCPLPKANAWQPQAAAPLLPPPANFSTPGMQPQLAWMEGPLKLVACKCQADPKKAWVWRLFNVTADAKEEYDLLPAQGALADAMFGRYQAWASSVAASRLSESVCSAQGVGGGQGGLTPH